MFHSGRFLDHVTDPARDSYPADLLDRDQLRRDLESSIAGSTSAVFVADDGDRLSGFMQVQPDGRFRRTASIGQAVVAETERSTGIGTALLAAAVTWSAQQGFDRCSVGWTSTNPISDPFWRNRGFQPVRYRLAREIDPWAAGVSERDRSRPTT